MDSPNDRANAKRPRDENNRDMEFPLVRKASVEI